MLLCSIQQPARRHSVRANRIQAVCSHQGKILLDHPWVVGLMAILIETKCPIGDAANIQLFIPNKDEFTLHTWAHATPTTNVRHSQPFSFLCTAGRVSVSTARERCSIRDGQCRHKRMLRFVRFWLWPPTF